MASRWLTPKGKGNPEVHEKGRGENALSEWTMGLGEKSAFPLFCKSLTSPSFPPSCKYVLKAYGG